MSKRFCGKCKSTNTAEDGYCGGWTYYRCETCGHVGDKDAFPLLTLFNHITQSPEVLAPYFVEKQPDKWDDDDYPYYSYLTKEWYATHTEALTATVAKLKEVAE